MPTPVFDGALLPQRSPHINAMGAHDPWVREIDEHTVVHSRVFVDELRQGLQEQGDPDPHGRGPDGIAFDQPYDFEF